MQVARKSDWQDFWIQLCIVLPFEPSHPKNICRCLQNLLLSNAILGLQLVKCSSWGGFAVWFSFDYLDFFLLHLLWEWLYDAPANILLKRWLWKVPPFRFLAHVSCLLKLNSKNTKIKRRCKKSTTMHHIHTFSDSEFLTIFSVTLLTLLSYITDYITYWKEDMSKLMCNFMQN